MPKIGMEPLRRKALIDATLRAVADRGSLSVTMADIARQANVSPALAHHYFGSKEQLLIATVRGLLARLKADTAAALEAAATPRQKLSAIIRVSFHAGQFTPETIAAWLAFYAQAQQSQETRRLLIIYTRRLRSNLLFSLKRLCPPEHAAPIAEGAAAMIDGLYVRQSLKSAPISIAASIALTEHYLDAQLNAVTGPAPLRQAEAPASREDEEKMQPVSARTMRNGANPDNLDGVEP